MSLRVRMALASAAAVAAAVVVASLATFVLIRGELRDGIDRSLRDHAARIAADVRAGRPLDSSWLRPHALNGRFGPAPGLARIVDLTAPPPPSDAALGDDALPAIGPGLEAARSGVAHIATVESNDIPIRILAVPLGRGRALEVARPLDEVEAELSRIGDVLLAISVAGVALAAVLGLLVARRALAPVRTLAAVVDDVTRTRQLDRRVEVRGSDELSRLGAAMNLMLAAVEDAVGAQQRLVADASHELRTPLTSLRADVGLLRRGDALDRDEYDEVVAGLDDRLTEMSDLLRELMQLAEGDLEPPPFAPLRLDELVDATVARLGRRDVVVHVRSVPVTVHAAAPLLERAVANLLDNAVKWSPSGAIVEVEVLAGGALVVRDHGPGISAEHLPHIFDRFYRADRSAGIPGFGLGLAIVRRIAETHGGSVRVDCPAGGGTVFTLTVPLAPDATAAIRRARRDRDTVDSRLSVQIERSTVS